MQSHNVSRRNFTGWLAAAWLAADYFPKTSQSAEPLSQKSTMHNLTQANNNFAFAMLKRLTATKPAENQFLSPFSIESALTIALEGAREKTAAEMGTALSFPDSLKSSGARPWDMGRMRKDYNELLTSLTPPSGPAVDETRRELTGLKQELEKVNAEVKQLSAAGNFTESNKLATKSRQLSQRVHALAKTVDQFELATANSLWVEKTYPLSKAFQQTVEQFYGSSEAIACNFSGQPEVERVRINDWVAKNTRDKILNIIPEGMLSPDTCLVIANAIYFKGAWAKPFTTSNTAEAEFTMAGGRKSNVQMMSAPGLDVANYVAFNGDGSIFETPAMVGGGFDPIDGYPSSTGFQAVELPYLGDRLSMLILLPRSVDGLNNLVESFNAEKFQACRAALKSRKVNVKMPKFKMETTYNLIPDLQALGMREAFSRSQANFSGLTESQSPSDRLFISIIIHKAFVEVNEEGTEAAAATVVGMERTAAPVKRPFIPDFTADHPFLAAIVDRQSDMILFIGKVESITKSN